MTETSSSEKKCGVYKTLRNIGEVPSGRLVYFHNHGDPGPGVYLPTGWKRNWAQFSRKGTTLTNESDFEALSPLALEGFYRVNEPFYCCEKRCTQFNAEMFVQLGYDVHATPIVFVPELIEGMIAIPEQGTRIDEERVKHLSPLRLAMPEAQRAASIH